jgi:hypothetical protein
MIERYIEVKLKVGMECTEISLKKETKNVLKYIAHEGNEECLEVKPEKRMMVVYKRNGRKE